MPDPITITKEALDGLVKQLVDQLKAPLDKRDTDLCEKLAREMDEKIAKMTRETDERVARIAVVGQSAAVDKDVKEFSFARLLNGVMRRNVKGLAPHEYAMCQAAAEQAEPGSISKDMSTTVDALGGFIVPAQVMAAQIIPLLQPAIVAFSAGVVRMPGLTGSPVPIPKITGATTAYWLGEVEAPTESDVTLGNLELFPHDVFSTVKLSNRLINLSAPGADLIVRKQMARDLGLKIDLGIYSGTGGSSQPTGILQTTGIGAVTSFGSMSASTAYDKLIDIEGALLDANAQTVGEFVWAMNPTVLRSIRKQKDPTDNSQPKARRMIEAGSPDKILDHRYVVSTQLPTDKILLGAHASAILGEWGTMIIASSNEGTNFKARTTEILCGMTVDVGVQLPEAFCVGTGVTA